MAKKSENFLCTDCGDTFSKWLGKCPSCNSFNTIKEFRSPKISTEKSFSGKDLRQEPSSHSNIISPLQERLSTQISEVDRVLGGGFFPGSFVLFGGNPGIGKSTLALQIFLNFLKQSELLSFYFSGEESFDQIFSRASRLSPGIKTSETRNQVFATNSL